MKPTIDKLYAPYLEFGTPTQPKLDRRGELKASFELPVRLKNPWGLAKLFGLEPCAMTMPGHDRPVAWRVQTPLMDVIACPAVLFGETYVGTLPDDVPVLDSEPGGSPARP